MSFFQMMPPKIARTSFAQSWAMPSATFVIAVTLSASLHGQIRTSAPQASATAVTFAAPISFQAGGSGAGSLIPATADFNGDGIPDLAISNLQNSSVSVLLGSGNGRFLAPVNYAVGRGPYGVVAGDFNGDGKPDLAVVNGEDSTVSILLNNGSGMFPTSPSNTYSVGSGPVGISIADLNKDGKPDLVITNNGSKTVSVLFGNSNGTFQAASSYVTGNYPYGTAVGDFNGDGYADLAVWNIADNTVGILLNDKTGNFLSQVTYATGTDPYSVAVGDFNGDGFPDLATANLGSSTVSILLNDKTGKFLPQVTYQTGSEPTSVLSQDLNGDGILDIAVTNFADGTLSVLLGKGDGTFGLQATSSIGSEPYAAIAVDMNGDSKPDLAITNFASNSVAIVSQLRTLPFDVTTYHFDNARTGLNSSENILTPANVTSSTFGKLNFLPASGKVDAEPLYVSSISINGQTRNVLYVASEDDSVYAFDADNGALLWTTSALSTGETTSDDHGCGQISPQIGITSTPVIDRHFGINGAIFIVAMTKGNSTYHQRLHALDLTNGRELAGSPTEITGTYPGTGANSSGGNVIFDPAKYAERVGLLLMNQTLYLGWTSHCDSTPYTGWVMAYSESTLKQTGILNLTPNGSEGAIWMSGAGLAGDSSGNIYLLDANGQTDTTFSAGGFPAKADYGNAIVKLSTANGMLAVADFFEPYNTVDESNHDVDLGSGGALLVPDQTDASGAIHHLLIGAGKDSNIYIGDRDHLGKFNATNNSNLYQELPGALPHGAWSMPAYFNNTVYYGGVGDVLRAFSIHNAKLNATTSSVSATPFTYPGATPSISANGNINGIVWALESGTGSPGVLHAYDATNLAKELYSSKQAANNRDAFGNGNKFITPVINNGKVFVPTQTGVAVFGLLSQP